MNIHFDINKAFADLHTQHREGKLSREDYDTKLKNMLVAAGKLPDQGPIPQKGSFSIEAEHSGCLSYDWKPDGKLSISFRTPWDGQHKLNGYPRHLRQAARVELEANMTEMEATKLRVAHAAGDTYYEAVMDDLLTARAEAFLQCQGPDAKKAVNLDERFHLSDNPDVIPREELPSLIHGSRCNDEMER